METPSLVASMSVEDVDDELTQPYTIDCVEACPVQQTTERLSPILLVSRADRNRRASEAKREEQERQLMRSEDPLDPFVLVPMRRKPREPRPLLKTKPVRDAKRKAAKQLKEKATKCSRPNV